MYFISERGKRERERSMCLLLRERRGGGGRGVGEGNPLLFGGEGRLTECDALVHSVIRLLGVVREAC